MTNEARRADEKQIRDTIALWLQSVQAKDAGKIAAFYTPDGRFLVPNHPIADGRASVQQAWQALLDIPGMTLTFGPTMIDVADAGDMAYEVGTYRLAFDGPKGGVEDRGKYVVVWKNLGGEWKAAADILNTDLPAS
jgi:ketosteroid isomerase-like protein